MPIKSIIVWNKYLWLIITDKLRDTNSLIKRPSGKDKEELKNDTFYVIRVSDIKKEK